MRAIDLPRYFENIGARLVVHGAQPRRFAAPEIIGQPPARLPRSYELDIAIDKLGEHFRMVVAPVSLDFSILQSRKDERHLLLFADGRRAGGAKERLLCGHDERHWFVAAVGEPVSTIMAARKALLPRDLRHAGLNKTTLKSRYNEVFKRQGEWFFVPVTDAALLDQISRSPVHRDEPIQRGRNNKPHKCDLLVRFGGTAVVLYKGAEYSQREWADKQREPGFKLTGRVENRVKDMAVYVRGGIRHKDHATIVLDGWHQVLLNGEIVSSNVTFYD